MSSILRLISRKIIEKLGPDQVAEVFAKYGLNLVRRFEVSEIPEKIGKVLVQDFLRHSSQTGLRPSPRMSPWLMLPPTFEVGGGEIVYKSYFPTKGEIVSLYKRESASVDSPESGFVRCNYQNQPVPPSSLSLPSRTLPWLMLPPAPAFGRGDCMVYKFYSSAKEKEEVSWGKEVSFSNRGGREETELMLDRHTRLVGSSHGWLASFNERSRDLFLSNPLSGRRIKLPPPPPVSSPSKVIVSCSPDEEECRAMMSFGLRRLAFCCPGRSKEWTPIGALYNEYYGLKCVRGYEDFVYSPTQKRFFSVLEDKSTIVEGWDLGDPDSPTMDWKDRLLSNNEGNNKCDDVEEEVELTDKDWCKPVRYLVFAEHSNQLFIVTRYILDAPTGSPIEDTKTIDFDVHRVDSGGQKLCYMNSSLDGLVMFVGINHSFALPASEFSGLKPNSIYFTQDKGGHDVGIFDYENRTCCPYNLFKRIQPAPLWFTPSQSL